MGHNRLGRLPKTHRWREVVELLDASPLETAAVAAAVVKAADRRLRRLVDDPSIGYCVWLLTRITWAARGTTFVQDLHGLGIEVTAESSAATLIARIGDRVRDEIGAFAYADHYAELSAQALRQALGDTVATEGASLFGSPLQDAQRNFRTYATQARFGELARRYFAAFMSRTLRSFVDRELANHVGTGGGFRNVAEGREFLDALDRHVWQTARIVEDFAGGWYSKHNWETKGRITPQETQQFLAVALRKFRADLRMGVT